MNDRSMRDFWDARAEENAYFFVDNSLSYADPDIERFWAGGEEVVTRMGELLGIRVEPGNEVVEIGCGVGRLTRTLVKRGARVRAIDVSPAMLEQARKLNADLEGVEWIEGDGRSLAAVPSGSTDACISFVVFQHIPDPEITLTYIREMGRVLRPGGWAAFQVSTQPAIHARRSLAVRARAWARSLLGRGPRGQGHAAWLGSAVPLDRLRDTARESGLATEQVVGAGTQYCLVLLRRG